MRLALSIVMSEHSILDSCKFAWLDFANALDVDNDDRGDGEVFV